MLFIITNTKYTNQTNFIERDEINKFTQNHKKYIIYNIYIDIKCIYPECMKNLLNIIDPISEKNKKRYNIIY